MPVAETAGGELLQAAVGGPHCNPQGCDEGTGCSAGLAPEGRRVLQRGAGKSHPQHPCQPRCQWRPCQLDTQAVRCQQVGPISHPSMSSCSRNHNANDERSPSPAGPLLIDRVSWPGKQASWGVQQFSRCMACDLEDMAVISSHTQDSGTKLMRQQSSKQPDMLACKVISATRSSMCHTLVNFGRSCRTVTIPTAGSSGSSCSR